MRKVLLIIGLIIVLVAAYGCGKKPPPPIEEPIPVVDTTPPPPPPVEVDTTPPPPPPPEVKETDFFTIYFDFDKSNIRDDQKRNLDRNAQILGNEANLVVKIEGHCDERGTIEYNLALGERRAVSVKKYLTDLGIIADRIQTISYGKERPVDPGHNEEAWAKNRRAYFKIIKK